MIVSLYIIICFFVLKTANKKVSLGHLLQFAIYAPILCLMIPFSILEKITKLLDKVIK